MPNIRSRIQLKLWLLLTCAFVCVGSAAIYLLSYLSGGQTEGEMRSELQSISRLVAAQVRRQDFNTVSDEDNARLAASLDRTLGIARIRVAVRDRDDFRLVRDTAEDDSWISLPDVRHELRRVFDDGVSGVVSGGEEASHETVSAYEPIIGPRGEVRAVVIVDQDAARLLHYEAHARKLALTAFLVVLILGAAFALIVARQFIYAGRTEPWYRGRRAFRIIFGATILELAVGAMTAGIVLVGLYSQIRFGQLRADQETSSSRSAPLQQYQNRIARILKDNYRDEKTISLLANWSAGEGMPELASALNTVRGLKTDAWKEPVWSALQALTKQLEVEAKRQAEIRNEMKAVGDNLAHSFILATLLSFGALFIVRTASNQQQQLKLAESDSKRHKVAYEQVAQNLPIGLYTFREGVIEDANDRWDEQVTRQPGEDRMMALERTVDPKDFAMLKGLLARAEQRQEGLQYKFKVHTGMSEIRHYETRGVFVSQPEEGTSSLLGFFLDVTSVVEATHQLEASNREVQAKNLMLSKALGDLENNLEAMVHGLVKAVEAKDPYTAGHSERVMAYSMKIGQAIGLSANDLRTLQRGTLIHDVGKIGIPDAILMKPARLDEGEIEVIKKHPLIGASMIRGIPVFEDCLPIVLSHHERLDGKGYPHGLAGDEIPVMVRIASVTDVFDALTSTRAYRSAMPVATALEILRKDVSLGMLDGKIVEVLADIVLREGILRSDQEEAA